jgi:CRP/FNR family cyclic AMP-dependent transcriptional regulator
MSYEKWALKDNGCKESPRFIDSSLGNLKMERTAKVTHDALDYLPAKPPTEYAKGSAIYSGNCESLYLVGSGRVKVSCVAADGCEATVRIVPADGFFGECALIDADGTERAVALDRVRVMAWSRAEIENQIEKDSRLGLALLEEFTRAILDLNDRVRAMATCTTRERVMLSLLQLQRTLGVPQAGGAMRMAPLSHMVIAQHVGTSRETVSAQMSRLRRLGLIRYSRKFIDLDCEAIKQILHNPGRWFTALSRS